MSGRTGSASEHRRTPGTPTVRRLLCHPNEPVAIRGSRGRCPACGSFWDLESCTGEFSYTETYALERRHLDPEVGRLKVVTLRRWLESAQVSARGRVVCEVGFGGGHCLADLASVADEVFGIEVIPENLRHAASLGLPDSRLYLFDERPPRLRRPVSLWIFQDSFEHILEPDSFVAWVGANSSEDALLLIVAPDASSRSQRWLGTFWPHRVPDHLFHWSAAGLVALYARHEFELQRRFRPIKRVSTAMLACHMRQTRLAPAGSWLERFAPRFRVWFNVGEMGLVLRRATP